MKACGSCGADLTGTHFNRKFCGSKCKRDKYKADNPDYFYNHSLGRFYGINRETYDQMGDAQGWLCAICGQPPSGEGNGGRLVVDHCHRTGKVRSLLCSLCNKGIGALRDDPDIVERAAMYLRSYK